MTLKVFYDTRKLKAGKMLASVQTIVKIYKARGLDVVQIDADKEIKCLKNDTLRIHLNTLLIRI